jgi:two-component system copper resistance phosphate regulon response regulator CusR
MRVMVVEGEGRMRRFLARAFQAEGFSVDVAADGEESQARALGERYDLMVMDLRLPVRNGLDVLREIHRRRPDLPVIVVSTRGDLATKLRSFELGAVDYLQKPFSLDELLARSRVQLRRPREPEEARLVTAGPLVLDLARRQVRVGDAVANLPDREFRLLHFLVANAGEVVSRERLLSAIWGYDFDPHSNVVDVCVRRLRVKLAPHEAIETVRNVGYRAVA